MASTTSLNAALSTLSKSALDWLNQQIAGGPLGPRYSLAQEVALGDRLNEISKVGVAQVSITGAATGTLSLGSDFAGAKCVGSIADLDGASVTLTTVSDADANGDVTVTLSGTAGGSDVVVSIAYDARQS
jgi:hypothetical protein